MRKLALITALLLASAAAHAGEGRGLMLAANDTPAATDTAAPLPPAAPAVTTDAPAATTDAPKPQADATPAKPASTKSGKRASAGRHESDETKARRIAARYGVYW
jgi:hypothetical protein